MTAWHRWDGMDLVLSLRVQPRASRDELVVEASRLRVRITAPPVDGAANTHLLRFLAGAFNVPPSRVQLIRGTTGREKIVRVLAPAKVPDALADALAGTRTS